MRRSLTAALLALAGALGSAGAAQAAVIDNDPVQIVNAKLDFGDNTFVAGAPTGSGNVEWNYGAAGVQPHVTGTLHMDNAAGLCARMRLEQFDRTGAAVSTTFGGTVCAADNLHHAFAVNLTPPVAPLTDRTTVSIEKQAAAGWTTVASSTAWANTHDDSVWIAPGGGAGFGGPGWLFGAPLGSGTVEWNLEDGTLEPHLTGTLHLNNAAGACARMKLRYLTEFGVLITSQTGATFCAAGGGQNSWNIDLAPFRGVLGQVIVDLQTVGAAGGWVTAGSQTVSVAV
jgi:hypothetical protein